MKKTIATIGVAVILALIIFALFNVVPQLLLMK